MSRFRAEMQALRGPLEFVRDHETRLDRVKNAAEAARQALERAGGLDLPPDAKRRIDDAARALAREPLDAELAGRMLERLGPLLDSRYPRRVMGLATDRLPGVGPKTARAFAQREVATIEDLLFFLPRSYEDRRELLPIEALQVGHPVCFQGEVVRCGVVPLRNGRSFLEAVVSDGTGAVSLKWFRGIEHFRERLRPGVRLLVAGEVRRYRYAKELHHPEIEQIEPGAPAESLPRIVPRYQMVDGVPPRTLCSSGCAWVRCSVSSTSWTSRKNADLLA